VFGAGQTGLVAQRSGAAGGRGREGGAASAVQQPPGKEPLASWLKLVYMTARNNIVRFADQMPEDGYDLRAGGGTQGRTFGQYLGHVSNLSYTWCSQAKGEKNPKMDTDLEKLATKAEKVKALHDAFAYCDEAYDKLTDASAMEMIDMTLENGQPGRSPRILVLILNYGHNNEVYGDLNTLMRLKTP
jgi:uncharacterized damage-inducible protein DinB